MGEAEHLIRRWADHPERGAPFVARWSEDARPARFAELPSWISAGVRKGLTARGIERPYTHQAEALDHIGDGRDVVVATPTASGKTLVYNAAVLTALEESPEARALYLFPTKALAHDQVVAFDALAKACDVHAAAFSYDGDTPADIRRNVRTSARAVFTNPDMLHAGILPHHHRWPAFFSGLRYVVIDEVHVYRGVFGSHLANVLRRLARICAFHGSAPRFVMSSATIANPGAHASALIERPVTAITGSGAPSAPRTFYVYNPPLVDGSRGLRASYVQSARRIARTLTEEGVPTIVFANSRLNVERLTRHLKSDVAEAGGDPEVVSGYRGGYLPGLRRAIEQALRSGHVRTVVSTSALELGVDVGQLEACVLAGYPGTVASTWQRAGRAGRREDAAVVVMVARGEPIDQYLAAHPEYFFGQSPEHARIEADNLLVVADHVKCAAFELPFRAGESLGAFGEAETDEVLGYLQSHRLVHRGADRWHWSGDSYPANGVNLRSIADGNFTVLDRAHGHRIIAEVDYHSAASTLYPQAIYTVGGETYQVMHLDWDGRRAEVDPIHVDYYTDAMTHSGVAILEVHDEAHRPTVVWGHGEVRVFEQVVGFKKIRWDTGENVGYGDVDLPDDDLHTTALWLRPLPGFDRAVALPRHRLFDALEGLGEALKSVATVEVMCDARDLGLTITDAEGASPTEDDGLPTVFLYERYPGGVGFHEHLFRAGVAVLDRAASLLAGCACEDGCPACVGAPAPIAHPDDRPRSRRDAARVLQHVRAALVDPALTRAAAG